MFRIFLSSLLLLAALANTEPGESAFAGQIRVGETPEARLAISEFNAQWQTAWQRSEEYRRVRLTKTERQQRLLHANCYQHHFLDRLGFIAQAEAPDRGLPGEQYQMIQGQRQSFGVCPSWLLGTPFASAKDEKRWRDGALLPAERATIARERVLLIDRLRAKHAGRLNQPWLAGQLVRLWLDGRNFGEAHDAALACSSPQWWCEGLRGLVFAHQDSTIVSEKSFTGMLAAMPADQRCSWEDLTTLFPSVESSDYTSSGCAEKAALNTRVWWLADPLFRIAGNARYVEQNVRRMELLLRQAIVQDERYSFDIERGGDALAVMLQRYGWPTYTAALGTIDDQWQTFFRVSRRNPAPPSPPYSTFEYSTQGVSTMPSWSAIAAPFLSTASDWQLHPADSLGHPATAWWPWEHFQPDYRLTQLDNGQHFFVRRQNYVETAISVPLTHPAFRDSSSRFDVMLLATTGPANVDSLAQTIANAGSAVYLRGPVASGPRLLAVEAIGVSDPSMAARVRYGIVVPPPLDKLEGDIGMSELALLGAVPETTLRSPRDALLTYMRPNDRIPLDAPSIALYWETYGIAPSDSAITTVRVASTNTASALRRIAVNTGIAPRNNSSIEVRWQDNEPRGHVSTLLGPVPVQMRTLQLNLGTLAPGPYAIAIAMRLKNGREVSNAIGFTLVPKDTHK